MIRQEFLAQSGAVFPFALGVLAALGLLLAILFQYREFDLRLNEKNALEEQTRLMAQAGASFALARLSKDGAGLRGIHYQSPGVQRQLEAGHGFSLKVWPFGLYTKILATGEVRFKDSLRSLSYTALAGQRLDIQSFPTLVLTNRQGDLTLAGKTSVRGAVLLWSGRVNKAQITDVRFTGEVGHIGKVLDSTSTWWDFIGLDAGKINDWMNIQEELILGGVQNDPDKDVAFKKYFASGPDAWEDTLVKAAALYSSGTITLGRGSSFQDCKIAAKKIRIVENANIENCLVYGSAKVEIMGAPRLGGQFLSRDSLILDVESTLEGFPLFFVNGRWQKFLRDSVLDSTYLGWLEVRRGRGQALLLFGGEGRSVTIPQIHIKIGQSVNLKGMIFANGYLDMKGSLEGSIICENFMFKHKGSIYLGHLMDVMLSRGEGTKGLSVPFPLVFPQKAPVLLFQGKFL